MAGLPLTIKNTNMSIQPTSTFSHVVIGVFYLKTELSWLLSFRIMVSANQTKTRNNEDRFSMHVKEEYFDASLLSRFI
jgi:hypothetical protein